MMRSFVDEGNDILTAEDIHRSLINSTLKNTQVSVVSFQKNECEVEGDKIQNISRYHSFEFTSNGMKLWRYFKIGPGNFQSYSKTWSFVSGLKELIPYTKCDINGPSTSQAPNQEKRKKKKERSDRKFCDLIFCTSNDCSSTFKTITELESHIAIGIHSVPKAASSFDIVKKSFANRMILAAQSNSYLTSSPIASSSTSSGLVIPLFAHQGWGLPVRSTFRFNAAQKTFLFKAFESGEKTGKKESPEEVHLAMRKCFSPDEYCTVKQIRALFSRWSQQVRSTSLVEVQEKLPTEGLI